MKTQILKLTLFSFLALIACSNYSELSDEKSILTAEKSVTNEQDNKENTEGKSDTVVIGSQTWMTSNLNELTFRNGDTILHASTNAEWTSASKTKTPAWCYLNNDNANGENMANYIIIGL